MHCLSVPVVIEILSAAVRYICVCVCVSIYVCTCTSVGALRASYMCERMCVRHVFPVWAYVYLHMEIFRLRFCVRIFVFGLDSFYF